MPRTPLASPRALTLTTMILACVGGVHANCTKNDGQYTRYDATLSLSPSGAVSLRQGESLSFAVTTNYDVTDILFETDCGPLAEVGGTKMVENHLFVGKAFTVTGKQAGVCHVVVADGQLSARADLAITASIPTTDASFDAPSDAPSDAPIDAPIDPDAGLVAHLYVSNRTAGSVARFRVVAGTKLAGVDGSFASAAATGLAFGPTGTLYVGNAADGTIARFAGAKATATPLAVLSAPTQVGWTPSGVLFVPTTAGAGELWVASDGITDSLAVYPLDSAGNLVGLPSLVSTGLGVVAGAHGIQGLAFDAPSSSLFAAADQVRRLMLVRGAGTWTLSPVTDSALTPLGAANPVGLVMAPNRWLFAAYPVPSFLNVGYWSVANAATTFVNGASGVANSFSPLAMAILPGQAAAEPVRVYTSTNQNQVVAIDFTASNMPTLTDLACNAPAPSWAIAGD
ncbi:MAG: Lactonase, 7-bladed beta-propeller [Myxococcales bacterium]|nr:Lactonase, 7-bladed beta-propeller [Myxococcales bacterium]